jgi:hypothetical protein
MDLRDLSSWIIMEWFKMILVRLIGPYQMSMESFFLPWKGNPRGSYWAVPNRFELPNEDPPSFQQNLHPPYDEEVYDLEPLRYPFKIRLMEDLPKRMIEQLRTIIAGKCIDPDLYYRWKLWQEDARREVSWSKLPTSTIANDTWFFLSPAFTAIHPNDSCFPDWDAGSRDERVTSDICLRLRSSGEKVVLGEGLYPRTAETHISNLVKLASGELPSSFEGGLPNKFVEHEAILARVWHLHINDYVVTLTNQFPSSHTR